MVRATSTAFSTSDLNMATFAAVTDYSSIAINSQEQMFSITQINKNKFDSSTFYPHFEGSLDYDTGGLFGAFGCVGPTNQELDPYFSSIFADDGTTFFREVDYEIVTTEDSAGFAEDLHIDKLQHRDVVQRVRTSTLKAPLILSGWGFDLGDRPVPRAGTSFPEIFQFDRETAVNREKWKSGPLAVQWDDERKVWAGGPQIVCGIVVKDGPNQGDIKAPKSPCSPTTFVVQLLRKSSDSNFPSPEQPSEITNKLDKETGGSDRITVFNRDPSLEQDYMENAMFVIAIRLNYEWLPLWVGCPDDDITTATCLQ